MSLSITGLYTYPVKSLAGISLDVAAITDRGLEYDRRWMLVGDDNVFLSQRTLPKMALLQPTIKNGKIMIDGEGQTGLSIDPIESGEAIRVSVWDDDCEAIVYPAEMNQWFTQALGQSARLVYMPDASRREVDPRYAKADEIVSFADGYPILTISEESLADLNTRLDEPVEMNRFRPNIVIAGGEAFQEDRLKYFTVGEIRFEGAKPCARCQVVTIDQSSGESSKEPLKTLAGYRRSGKKVLFGMNLLHQGTGTIAVGDRLQQVIHSH